jgi:DNA-binding response OmpR family regulator
MTMPRCRVLVVDDDDALCGLLTEYLARFGMTVTAAGRPEDALRLLREAPPDLVVLDVMLPDEDGFAVCRRIRERSPVPVIMLTARGDLADRVLGLTLGADDYLPKPFEPRELVARIEAVLRRGAPDPAGEVLRAGPIALDLTARTATLDGAPLSLTTAELELLALLVRSRGRVLTRERILDETRGLEWESFDRSVDVLVSRLRHKLSDDHRAPRFIRTVWGKGYLFVGGGDD